MVHTIESPVVDNIRAIIKERGMKQCAVAQKAGYTSKQFSNMLTHRKVISVDDVLRITATLGVSPNDLFSNK